MTTIYAERLEAEIAKSEQFTKNNFGLQIGDEYPEMVRELAKSEKVSIRLIMGLVMGSFGGKEISECLKLQSEDGKPDLSTAILRNAAVFETPLALFYWGVQVGRQIEREQSSLINDVPQHPRP